MGFEYKFTYIIGYRHKLDRLNNLKRTLDWINSFSGGQIILVEQDTHSKISNLNLRCEHIFVKSKMPYNRSWGFNIGLKYSKSNVIIFGDSDLVMEPNSFIKAINKLSEYEMVNPYNNVVDLNVEESMLPMQQMFTINKVGRLGTNISGGIAMFRKEAILKIGGWDENFWAWGGEDDLQTIKVKLFLSWTELSANCYHFFHNKENLDMNFYKRNLEILNKVSKMNKDEVRRMINNSIANIGMKNKCDNF